jgi:hypothetical protein
MVALSLLAPSYAMFYFHLLGRVAWYCSGRYEEKKKRKKR